MGFNPDKTKNIPFVDRNPVVAQPYYREYAIRDFRKAIEEADREEVRVIEVSPDYDISYEMMESDIQFRSNLDLRISAKEVGCKESPLKKNIYSRLG